MKVKIPYLVKLRDQFTYLELNLKLGCLQYDEAGCRWSCGLNREMSYTI